MALVSDSGLRRRLVDCAIELLGERGVEGLSLREVARRAGVSHGAPLRHFPSLVALLSEVAATGFVRLDASVSGGADATGPNKSPLERLAGGGRGYVAFALADPGIFSLMWRADLLDMSQPSLAEAAPASFETLTTLVAACQEVGWHSETDTALLAAWLWAAVHGLSQLWLFSAYQVATGALDIDTVVETTIALLLAQPCPSPREHTHLRRRMP